MPPDFMTFGRLDMTTVEKELGIFSCKYRWGMASYEEIVDGEGKPISETEQEMIEEEEIEARQIFNFDTKQYNMQNLKATDLKTNVEVKLPGSMNSKEEAKLEVRIDKYRETIKSYMKSECNKKGYQQSNLSKEQFKGYRS